MGFASFFFQRVQIFFQIARIQQTRPLVFNLLSEKFLKTREFGPKFWKSQFSNLEKYVLKIKRVYIELSEFFLIIHNGRTQVYRLVSGQLEVWLQRNRDYPKKEDDYAPLPLLIRAERQILQHLIKPATGRSISDIYMFW